MLQPRYQWGGGTQKHSGPDGGALRLINKAWARQFFLQNCPKWAKKGFFFKERLECRRGPYCKVFVQKISK